MKRLLNLVVIALFVYAGVLLAGNLAFNENQTITKYLKDQGVPDKRIEEVLALPRIGDGPVLYVADNWKIIALLDSIKVGPSCRTCEICFTGSMLSDYRDLSKRKK